MMRRFASVFVLTAVVGLALVGREQFSKTEKDSNVSQLSSLASMVPLQAPAPAPASAPAPVAAAPVAAPVAAAPAAPTPPAPTGDVLTDTLNTKKFEVAPTMQPTSSLLKQVLSKNKPQQYQVQLPGPPYCHTFVAAAGATVADINLKLENPAGAIAATDNVPGNVAVIANHCPTVPGSYKLTVEIPGGEGEFAVQVFSK